MATCLVIQIPGGTVEQYDQIEEALGEPKLGDGQISHVAGPTDDGFCVIDVWESRAHFDRFMEERLGEQLGAAGISQPQILQFDVHNLVTRD